MTLFAFAGGAMGRAACASRANPVAVLGAAVFALAYAWIAHEASLFVFRSGPH